MHQLTITNKVADSCKINRAVAALVIGVSSFSALTNEKLKVFIESPEGSDITVIPEMELKPIMMMEAFGEGNIWRYKDGMSRVNVLIGNGGAYELAQQEFLVPKLSSLKIAQTYEIRTLESGKRTTSLHKYEQGVVLAGFPNANLPLGNRALMVIKNYDKITEFQITPKDGIPYKADFMDLLCLQVEQNEALISDQVTNIADAAPSVSGQYYDDDYLLVDCSSWDSVLIVKDIAEQIDITYKNI